MMMCVKAMWFNVQYVNKQDCARLRLRNLQMALRRKVRLQCDARATGGGQEKRLMIMTHNHSD